MLICNHIKPLLSIRDESAQTLTEYGLIFALVSLVGLIGLGLFSGGARDLWDVVNTAATCMSNIIDGGSCS